MSDLLYGPPRIETDWCAECSRWTVLTRVAPGKWLCAACKALRSLEDWERRLIRLEQLGRAIQAGKETTK